MRKDVKCQFRYSTVGFIKTTVLEREKKGRRRYQTRLEIPIEIQIRTVPVKTMGCIFSKMQRSSKVKLSDLPPSRRHFWSIYIVILFWSFGPFQPENYFQYLLYLSLPSESFEYKIFQDTKFSKTYNKLSINQHTNSYNISIFTVLRYLPPNLTCLAVSITDFMWAYYDPLPRTHFQEEKKRCCLGEN